MIILYYIILTRFFGSSKTRILTAKMDGIEWVATRGDEGGSGDDAGVVVTRGGGGRG